jgi:predicted DNA-binding protein (UPF0251 family)
MAAAISTLGLVAPDEPLQALHQEIARLPEKFRRAVILCDLQRVPQDRAATELRLSERTLQRRLSEGRERLKARLIRRGLAPEGGMLGAVFPPGYDFRLSEDDEDPRGKFVFGAELQPGQTKDLGDVRLTADER